MQQQPSLQDMIQMALREGQSAGRQKIAQETTESDSCERCGKTSPEGSKLCRECAQMEAEKEQSTQSLANEKTSSVRIEKLAAALDTVASNLNNLDWRRKFAESTNDPTVVEPKDLGTQVAPGGKIKNQPPITPKLQAVVTSPSPTAMPTDEDKSADRLYPAEGVLTTKQGSMQQAYAAVLRRKMAAAMGDPEPNISAPKSDALPEDRKSGMARPAEVTRQVNKMLSSNEAAMNITQRDAKEAPKKRMGEVFSEPALSAKTDTTLDAAFGADTVDQAGAKIAAARVLLQKIAAEGCTCKKGNSEEGSCDSCVLKKRLGEKNAMVGGHTAPGITPAPPMAPDATSAMP